jgi:hypothetical protein
MADIPDNIPRDPTWETARGFAHHIGPMPSRYHEVMRTLWKAHKAVKPNEAPSISEEVLDAVKLIERSSILRVPIYFAASSLYPERFEANTDDDIGRAVVSILRPGLFAVVLTLLYYHRRLKKILPEVPLSSQLSEEYISAMEAGFCVGIASTHPGDAAGMLVAGLRVAALGAFLAHDPETFAHYKRTFKKPWNLEHERKTWGCDQAQIAAILMHDLQFHKSLFDLAVVFRQEFGAHIELPDDVASWRSTLRLIDYARAPSVPTPGPAYFSELQLSDPHKIAILMARLNVIAEGNSSFSWMLRSSKDVDDEIDNLPG